MKTFWVDKKRVETRLLMHHPDGQWAGYSYEWNNDQTDAALLPAGKTKLVGGQTWTYPNRAQCVECHTDAAGRSLGPELAQLNRDFTYGNRVSNQLDTIDHIGLLDSPVPSPAPRFPALDGQEPLETRARAYLHVNCSNCHRPGGTGQGPADFRFSSAFKSVGICNAAASQGDLGTSGALLLAPGKPEQSIVSLRTHALDVNRMPPLASHLVDDVGTGVIDAWIASLTDCPQ
jgi:mono/diheme cytochrome c family protein